MMYLFTTKQWPHWYAYAQDNEDGNARGWGDDPGMQGQWILTKRNNYYLISTAKWPGWYLYMQDNEEGNVRCWKGDPGPQGHWYIQKTASGYHKFSTRKWPNWFMYMQDVDDGNIRGWEGDPGPQGHWFLDDSQNKGPVSVVSVECVLDPICQVEKGIGCEKEMEIKIKVGTKSSSLQNVTRFSSEARAKIDWGSFGGSNKGNLSNAFASAALQPIRKKKPQRKFSLILESMECSSIAVSWF